MKSVSLSLLILSLLLWGCVKLSPLASLTQDNTDNFGAGDTTYIQINPVWDETFGLDSPVEISLARDGHLYVADSSAHSIWVLDRSGNKLPGFDMLEQIQVPETSDLLVPIDVDVDSKMNVLFIDGSNRVYVWNQSWNTLGIDAYAESGNFIEDGTGNTIFATAGSAEWVELANNPDWTLNNIQWSQSSVVLDSMLKPHVLFDGSWLVNQTADLYYSSDDSRFSALSATEGNDNFFFAADQAQDRIIKIKLEHALWVRTPDGDEFWTHRGVFGGTIAQYGTGSGTVNNPVGMDVDYTGSVYYAQLGDYFSVHKIRPVITGGYTTYSSVFQPGVNNIMDLGRFDRPLDVAVDRNQMIYVANSRAREIQVFSHDGDLFKKAGVEQVLVDTTWWEFNGTDSVEVDTFVVQETANYLENPSAVTVDDQGVIYVCDTPAHRIVRYRLSNVLDENLITNP
ncbi:MAG: hypothetical protein GXO90_03030 [FCB group bacterium]|nr:hypothetical protein [FCB group bacterium]